MGWAEAWRLSGPPFDELAFQATYGLRAGNLPLGLPDEGLARRARRQVRLSKFLVSLVLGATILGGLYAIASPRIFVGPADLPRPLYDGAVVSALFLLEFALLWWTSLQVIPVLLASRSLPLLETLPLDRRTRDRVALLVFLRLFDLPAATSVILTPVAVAVALGSPWAGLATVPGTMVTVVFALALGLATSRYFVRRVHGSSGGWPSAAARWLLLCLWTLPALALYGVLTFTGPLLGLVDGLRNAAGPTAVDALCLAWPLPLALLPPLAAGVPTGAVGPAFGWVIAAGAVGYGLVGAAAVRWLGRAPRELGVAAAAVSRSAAPLGPLHRRPPPLAVVAKDLTSASRVPGFAFLILLPVFESAALGTWTLLHRPTVAEAGGIVLAALASAAFVATFFGPAFFAIELQGYAYTRSLPLSARTLLAGKVGFIGSLYLVAAGLALALVSLRVSLPPVLGLALAAELPAVLAAATLELGLLLRLARRRGVAVVNLYTGAWWGLVVEIPGLFVALAPLGLFEWLRLDGSPEALPAMVVLALLTLALALPVGWVRRGGV